MKTAALRATENVIEDDAHLRESCESPRTRSQAPETMILPLSRKPANFIALRQRRDRLLQAASLRVAQAAVMARARICRNTQLCFVVRFHLYDHDELCFVMNARECGGGWRCA